MEVPQGVKRGKTGLHGGKKGDKTTTLRAADWSWRVLALALTTGLTPPAAAPQACCCLGEQPGQPQAKIISTQASPKLLVVLFLPEIPTGWPYVPPTYVGHTSNFHPSTHVAPHKFT